MSKRVQLIRGVTGVQDAFTGLQGEITVDVTQKELRLHDGLTAGGIAHARADLNNVAAVTQAVDGKMTATDKVKLDNIETAATADQTGAEIKALYEAEADTNAFTDALLTKLNGIETAATADQTGAEIKTLYEAEANTNAFTDAEKTKLAGMQDGAGFPAGTLMLFQQTSAPTGWTKQVTHNDKSLRVVSGAAGSAGSVAFSTVFGRTATDSHTLVEAEIPSHNHGSAGSHTHNVTRNVNLSGSITTIQRTSNATSTGVDVTSSAGAHTHSAFGGSGGHTHNIDLRVQYVDVIIASKD